MPGHRGTVEGISWDSRCETAIDGTYSQSRGPNSNFKEAYLIAMNFWILGNDLFLSPFWPDLALLLISSTKEEHHTAPGCSIGWQERGLQQPGMLAAIWNWMQSHHGEMRRVQGGCLGNGERMRSNKMTMMFRELGKDAWKYITWRVSMSSRSVYSLCILYSIVTFVCSWLRSRNGMWFMRSNAQEKHQCLASTDARPFVEVAGFKAGWSAQEVTEMHSMGKLTQWKPLSLWNLHRLPGLHRYTSYNSGKLYNVNMSYVYIYTLYICHISFHDISIQSVCVTHFTIPNFHQKLGRDWFSRHGRNPACGVVEGASTQCLRTTQLS